ncbi:MAG: D-alanine--D-alanine ligase, partial [Spirochaetaceae bacterium]|nr:D-alanine--D-alanine ligase [Spirochaetaceae bacterium]
MKRIAILYGGKSGEHEVSLMSAASIVRHLDAAAFEPLLIGI